MKKRADLDPNLYYFCIVGKNPNIGKILNCCVGKGCPLMRTKPRKKTAVQLVQIEEVETLSSPPS